MKRRSGRYKLRFLPIHTGVKVIFTCHLSIIFAPCKVKSFRMHDNEFYHQYTSKPKQKRINQKGTSQNARVILW